MGGSPGSSGWTERESRKSQEDGKGTDRHQGRKALRCRLEPGMRAPSLEAGGRQGH